MGVDRWVGRLLRIFSFMRARSFFCFLKGLLCRIVLRVGFVI